MRKRFEGVFPRYNENPPSILPEGLAAAIAASTNEAEKKEWEAVPKHERVKTNNAAFAVLRELATDPMMSKEAGAELNFGLKIEDDVVRLTVEMQSEHHAIIAEAERAIQHAIENHRGKFTDLSSGLAK